MNTSGITLYHYTSINGVIGIFNNDCVWATKIQFMNDYKEFRHAIDLAREALGMYKANRCNHIVNMLSNNLFFEIDALSDLNIYVSCFSEVPDSLSQWRGYCPPSQGYCVGFNAEVLTQVANEQGFWLFPCVYTDEEQNTIINEWVDNTMEEMIEHFDDGVGYELFWIENKKKFMTKFIEIAARLKHSAFKDEGEWRLIMLADKNDPRIDLRAGKTMLIPYIPVKLNMKEQNHLIEDVCVGPTPNIDLASESASFLTMKANIANGIIKTEIPYRDW